MNKLKLIIVIIFTFIFSNVATAQQTIISVPSSDVLPSGEIILKESNKFSPWNDSFVSLTPSIIMGTGKDTETSFGVGTTLDDTTKVKLDIASKKVFRVGKASRFTIGGRVSPTLTDSVMPDNFLYAHGSYLIKETKTTITSGVYIMGKTHLPDKTGALIGIDQTIIPNKLRIVADWMSRNDTGSALSAGFKIRPSPKTSITAAVMIPNSNEDRLAFSISISQYMGDIFNIIKKEKDNL